MIDVVYFYIPKKSPSNQNSILKFGGFQISFLLYKKIEKPIIINHRQVNYYWFSCGRVRKEDVFSND